MRRGACLAETVSLFDRNFQPFVYRLNELLSQWCSSAVEHAETAEVIFIDYRVLSQQQNYWWNDVRKRYLVPLNDGAKILDLEFGHHD